MREPREFLTTDSLGLCSRVEDSIASSIGKALSRFSLIVGKDNIGASDGPIEHLRQEPDIVHQRVDYGDEITQNRFVFIKHLQRMLQVKGQSEFAKPVGQAGFVNFLGMPVAQVAVKIEAGLAHLIT